MVLDDKQSIACPYCGEIMEEGEIVATSLRFTRLSWAPTSDEQGSKQILDSKFWGSPKLRSYRCNRCFIIISKVPEEKR